MSEQPRHKTVTVDQLRVGMYVHELGSTWLASPFWSRSFALREAAQLHKIRGAGIRHAVIDLQRGCDVAPEPEPAPAPPPAPPRRADDPASADIDYAAAVVATSQQAMRAMFSELRMGKAVDASRASAVVADITAAVLRNADVLLGLVRLKHADDYTYMHSVAVCGLMVCLARELQFDSEQQQLAGLAGLLHDVGKMAVPLDILNKPGSLSDEEFHHIRRHPEAGAALLSGIQGLPAAVLDVCLHHHEKMDGSGYPHGLRDATISQYARMGAVCDVYDAITSNRPYKQGWCPAESVRRMAGWASGHFDPAVFAAFVKCLGIYPAGTLVRLQSERLALVVAPNPQSLLRPGVRLVYDIAQAAPLPRQWLDLAANGAGDSIVGSEDAAVWGLDLRQCWLGADA
jgi:putative nucleotidyltransferase with HDIG domain